MRFLLPIGSLYIRSCFQTFRIAVKSGEHKYIALVNSRLTIGAITRYYGGSEAEGFFCLKKNGRPAYFMYHVQSNKKLFIAGTILGCECTVRRAKLKPGDEIELIRWLPDPHREVDIVIDYIAHPPPG